MPDCEDICLVSESKVLVPSNTIALIPTKSTSLDLIKVTPFCKYHAIPSFMPGESINICCTLGCHFFKEIVKQDITVCYKFGERRPGNKEKTLLWHNCFPQITSYYKVMMNNLTLKMVYRTSKLSKEQRHCLYIQEIRGWFFLEIFQLSAELLCKMQKSQKSWKKDWIMYRKNLMTLCQLAKLT